MNQGIIIEDSVALRTRERGNWYKYLVGKYLREQEKGLNVLQ